MVDRTGKGNMSKYRKRKSKLYEAIEKYDGVDMSGLSEEECSVVSGLLSTGYLVFDDSR